jgi:hypothetical protein
MELEDALYLRVFFLETKLRAIASNVWTPIISIKYRLIIKSIT